MLCLSATSVAAKPIRNRPTWRCPLNRIQFGRPALLCQSWLRGIAPNGALEGSDTGTEVLLGLCEERSLRVARDPGTKRKGGDFPWEKQLPSAYPPATAECLGTVRSSPSKNASCQPRAGLSGHFTSAIVFFWTP